jgi:lipoprotein-releasing system permease protein
MMKMNYETRIGLRYLRSKKKGAFVSFTTWISVVGIAIGVMALIVVIAVMTGFQDEIKERILGVNPHILIMSAQGEIKEPEELVAQIKEQKGIAHVFPFISFQAMVQSGRQLSGVAVKGINPDDVGFMQKIVKEGSIRSLAASKHVIIGKELAKRLGLFVGDSFMLMIPFGDFSPMGAIPETVKVRVGGLFETGMYDIDNTLVLMSLKDVQSIFGTGASGLEIKLQDVYQADSLRWDITRRLGPPYFGRTWIEMNRNLFSALKLEKLIMFIILALIIFVASFNIVSSLIMTVMEKKKDIAILRAMGAKKQSIMKIFMMEGIIVGVVGVLIGFVSGYLMCEIQKRYKVITLPEDIYNIGALPMKISALDMLLVVSVTMLICIVSTLYPSYKAAKIDPVETLRYE